MRGGFIDAPQGTAFLCREPRRRRFSPLSPPHPSPFSTAGGPSRPYVALLDSRRPFSTAGGPSRPQAGLIKKFYVQTLISGLARPRASPGLPLSPKTRGDWAACLMRSRPPGASRGEKDEPTRRFASSGDVGTPGVTCRAGRDIKDGTQSRRFSAGGASRPRAAATRGLARRTKNRTPSAEGVRQHVLWWRRGDSNPRPLPCEGSALPAELRPQAHRALAIVAAPRPAVKRQWRSCGAGRRPSGRTRRAASTSRPPPPPRAARRRARS